MSAARTISLAVLVVLSICLIGSAPVYSQNSTIFNTSEPPGSRTKSGAWLAKCSASSLDIFAGVHSSEVSEWPAGRNVTPGDFSVSRAPDVLCVESAPFATPRARADNPCPETAVGATGLPRVPGVLRTPACNDSADAVLPQLTALGKAGMKIARAREEVLGILRSENACSEWFATKDASPAVTFQSLDFVLDKHGPQEVVESGQAGSIVLWRQPYVARATQDGGPHTAITINAYGAFYRPQGNVLKVIEKGGPVRGDGTVLLTVGSYAGDTLPAQMVTLLHEYGHVIDLLPEDADNLDGKSVQNTNEVLRHCRAEVQVRSQQAKQQAKR
jgi:hypothetical protein